MICMQRNFGQPVMVPPGNTARNAPMGVTCDAQPAAHARDDMVHMRVRLGHHELLDAHRPRLAHAPEVIALEVDQHDVLGALLGVRDESGGLCARLLPAAGCAAGSLRWVASRPRHR